MQDFFRNHYTTIIVGIITSIVCVYLIQSILESLGVTAIQFGTFIGAAYVDELFAQVAHLEIVDFSFFWTVCIFGFIAGSTMLSAIFIWIKPKPNDSPKEITIKKKVFVSILLLFISFMSIVFISTKTYELTIISSFKQHMRILAPLMKEQEEEELLSKWSLMKTANDYDLIYEQMTKLAKTNNLKLPENKIYHYNSI